MNVFVLNTGRCGSTTFIEACKYITNYSAAHESRIGRVGEERLAFSENHIEADNRLSWFLGRLHDSYGDRAFYVHLTRNREDTAASFTKRADFGIMQAYREGILLGVDESRSPYQVALDYIDTVERNIGLFLRDKTNKMEFHLENAMDDFTLFWSRIGAKGDLQGALQEWHTSHNAS